ncbi:MAG: hypothetical protein NTV43_11900 [Methylococcales bacterium]|nr:hypothetical protein [Methylococcales bacterium]
MAFFDIDKPNGKSLKAQLIEKAGPWLTGSGIASGQAFLATGCSVPKIGKCVGCGSCIVAVVTLTGWALGNQKARKTQREQGLEPFETRTANFKH